MEKLEQLVLDELYEKYKLIELEKEKFYLIIKDVLEDNNNSDLKKLLNLCLSTLSDYSISIFNSGKFIDCIETYLKKEKEKINIAQFRMIENLIDLSDYTPTYEECIKVLKVTEKFIKKLIDNNENIELSFLESLIELYKLNNDMLEHENIKDLDKISIEDDFYYTPDDVRAYLKEISRYPLLSIDEERELLIEYKNGSIEAYNALINSNLRLVVYIARRYKKRGLDFLDLIQEGNIGLMEGIERFDITKKVKLSSYVYYWIKRSIIKAIIEKGKTIKIPKLKYAEIDKYKKETKELSDKLGRSPKVSEILSDLKLSINKFNEINNLIHDTISIYAKIELNDDAELGDFIENKDANVAEVALKRELKDRLRIALIDSDLTQREIEVLEYVYGLKEFYEECTSMRDVSKILNISPQRVRQIREAALERLRNSEQIKRLHNYIKDDEDLNVKNKRIGKYISMKELYIYLYDYPTHLIDIALDYLTISEIEILNRRYDKSEKEILKNPLNSEDREAVIKVRKKLIRIMEKMKKGTFVAYRDSNLHKGNKTKKKV